MIKIQNILTVTACLKRCSLAALYNSTLFETNENIDAATNLVWLADKFIRSHDIELNNLGGIVTCSGPGSFTGIRTAQSFSKAVALSLQIPSFSVNYFDVIYKICVPEQRHEQAVIIVIKSEKNQVYYKIFHGFKENASENTLGISSYESLKQRLQKASVNNFVLIGDAIHEIIPFFDSEIRHYIYIDDFRNAKYLLNFSEVLSGFSGIQPIYINANSNT